MDLFIIAALVAFGLITGSFMNMLVYRVPLGLNIAKPSSRCDNCGHVLKFYENIPVISYIFLGAKCSSCKQHISIIYPLCEVTTAIMFVCVYLKFGLTAEFYMYAFFCYMALLISYTDIATALDKKNFETGVIPDIYVFLGVCVGLGFAFYNGTFTQSLAGAAAGYLVLMIPASIYKWLRNLEGIGEGDFGLLAMIGIYTGVASIPFILTFAALMGILIGIVVIAITKDKRYAMPFAPMLSAGGVVYVFFAEYIQKFI